MPGIGSKASELGRRFRPGDWVRFVFSTRDDSRLVIAEVRYVYGSKVSWAEWMLVTDLGPVYDIDVIDVRSAGQEKEEER